MASVNPSALRAFNTEAQNLFTITHPYSDIVGLAIANVSKASTAVVSIGAPSVISATGTVGSIAGSDPYTATITDMTTTEGLEVGQIITATDGVSGTLGDGTVHITEIVGNTSITIVTEGGSTPVAGAITDISVASKATLPGTFVDGTKIIITGVLGMTELATAGVDGSNEFYVGVINETSFGLYTDVDLQVAVDSSGFTTATANTGTFEIFTVTQYESVGSTATAQFNASSNGTGTDIDIDFATGLFQLTGGANTYELVATASVSSPGATYQWYDFTNSATVGSVANVGFPVTGLFKNDSDANIGLVVTSQAGTTFQYPAQITNVQAVVTVISGFIE